MPTMPTSFRIDRRDFLRCSASLGALACLPGDLGLLSPADQLQRAVDDIVARIQPPLFPNRDFDVRRYGAQGDGRSDCRAAMTDAIGECHRAGGGRVVVPAGTYLMNGPIRMASNVNLHVERYATIVFGTNPRDYLPAVLVRWESTRCYNYSPLIYAYRQENIAITGDGTFDGQAQQFWGAWKSRQDADQIALRLMGSSGTPVEERVFGEGHYLRPTMCEFYDCRHVLLDGVTFGRSPFWTMHPVFCTNVTVRGIRVIAGTTNDDGCDPDSCADVLIENCVFDTADDHIAIKAGRDQDAWGGRPCENIVIRGCTGTHGLTNGYAIGSEMSGGVRNVYVLDSRIENVRKSALYIKSNTDRGGAVENVWARNVKVGECSTCIEVQADYKAVADHPYPAAHRDFHFEDIVCRTATSSGIKLAGVASKPIEGIYLKDVTIDKAARDVDCAHARSVTMENVRVNGSVVHSERSAGGSPLRD